jgi:hypothetical protein
MWVDRTIRGLRWRRRRRRKRKRKRRGILMVEEEGFWSQMQRGSSGGLAEGSASLSGRGID